MNLTASSEIVQNSVQGQIVSPTGKFEALQTSDGHSLLFTVDSSGCLQIYVEQSGTTPTGWQVHVLSTSAIHAIFPGSTDAVVRTFDVGERAMEGGIYLTMAVTAGYRWWHRPPPDFACQFDFRYTVDGRSTVELVSV
jgi:hypothetical protein